MKKSYHLNERSHHLLSVIERKAADLGVEKVQLPKGATGYDFGINASGSLEAGKWLALVCMSDLASISWTDVQVGDHTCASVKVRTDQPVIACMASQYAGMQVSVDKYFAIGSGPMRALCAEEELFEKIGYSEQSEVAVGILETGKTPTQEVVEVLSNKLKVFPFNLHLLFAPTASIAGGFQVVARSVETSLHKLVELGYDINKVIYGEGSAPLPPVARDDLEAMGRTNDGILYGGQVKLHVTGDDQSIERIGKQTPSSASEDYGEPFVDIFKRYNQDFYQIDKLLFSPAQITFRNTTTNNEFHFGQTAPEVLERSFSS